MTCLVFACVVAMCALTLATDDIVIRVRPGNSPEALAQQYGMRIKRRLDRFPNTYVLTRVATLSRRMGAFAGNSVNKTSLTADTRIEWAELQQPLERTKRGFIPLTAFPRSNFGRRSQSRRSTFSDPHFRKYQWYLTVDQEHQRRNAINMNIDQAWNMGLTGKGVVITIVDDGIEYNHTEIKANYDPRASLDVNDVDEDPFPRYDTHNTNAHGTKCAGEIAMAPNNGICGVGVAHNAKIGGIRILDGTVRDDFEAMALSHALDHIDIFSSSWGPKDDGKSVDGPKVLASEALAMGVKLGRGGLGVIYIWASGNGGGNHDNCNCDGYVSSIYTLSIAAASENGEFPWYGERCASTLAVAFSSGSIRESKVLTTTLHNQCVSNHTGTSAAAPIAAGVIALLLESNPRLSWRDVQHLVVYTSSVNQLARNRGWRKNAAGLLYNSRFGFGLIDAKALITNGARWNNVPPMVFCNTSSDLRLPYVYRQQNNLILFSTDACRGFANEVNSLEYVTIQMDIETVKRGSLEMYLTSPSGTVSMLLSKRPLDVGKKFVDWFFTSAHFWGESARGTWQLYIRDKGISKLATMRDPAGVITSLRLILYGTRSIPVHLTTPRVYPYDLNVNSFIDNEREWDEEERNKK